MSLPITDEVQQALYFSTMDATLDLCYALHAFGKIGEVAVSKCDGCKVDHPSQIRHDCIMLELEEKLDQYFNAIFDSIDEDEVFNKWEQEVTAMNIPSEIVTMYKLKVFCSDYRETLHKSEGWKTKLHADIRRLIRWESRLI